MSNVQIPKEAQTADSKQRIGLLLALALLLSSCNWLLQLKKVDFSSMENNLRDRTTEFEDLIYILEQNPEIHFVSVDSISPRKYKNSKIHSQISKLLINLGIEVGVHHNPETRYLELIVKNWGIFQREYASYLYTPLGSLPNDPKVLKTNREENIQCKPSMIRRWHICYRGS